jgi:hypothetical protein
MTSSETKWQSKSIWLAWSGWQMRIPADWRPLRVEHDRGVMMVGDGVQAIIQIKWWRHGKKDFDSKTWIRQRTKRLVLEDNSPGPADFSPCGWALPAVDESKAIWCGYAPRARLALEIVINRAVSDKVNRLVVSRVLPSLVVTDAESPTRWAIFDVSFETPPGFGVRSRHVKLGDVALEFVSDEGARLVIRQVYPAILALQRRKMAGWLDFSPFKEYRRCQHVGKVEEWSVASGNKILNGFRRRGHKRLPFPLSWISPKWSLAAVLQDEELDRLIVTEYDSPRKNDEGSLMAVLETTNWAKFESGES